MHAKLPQKHTYLLSIYQSTRSNCEINMINIDLSDARAHENGYNVG